jgi:hypothetical protein
MSIGLAGFHTGVAIAKQGTNGTAATTGFVFLPAEDADSLDYGQSYIQRNPAYGLRTNPGEFHRRDYYMPGGQLPSWAMGFDGSSVALLTLLRAFYQNYTITDAGGGSSGYTWAFSPLTANKSSIASYETYTVSKVTGLSGTRNIYYKDSIGVGLDLNWSAGDVLKAKLGVQSISTSISGTPSGWGAVPTVWRTIGASEQAWSLYISTGTFTLYPTDISSSVNFAAPDIAGAGLGYRARITPGIFSGNCTLTVPRNADVWQAIEDAGDVMGTFVCTLSPAATYTSGTLNAITATARWFGKLLRDPMPAGPSEDVTGALEMNVHNHTWSVLSAVGSAAI